MAMDCPSRSGHRLLRARAVTGEAPRDLPRTYLAARTALDWIGALVLLALCAPLLVALMLLVRCTSAGPAFYTQVRLGCGGRPFRVWKLRTMTDRCEEATGPVWSLAADPRVTPV